MSYILIGLATALFVFGIFQASVLFAALVRGLRISVAAIFARAIYAGIGVGGGFWLLSLANVL